MRRRAVIAVVLLVAIAAGVLVALPYFHGLSFVVRAADEVLMRVAALLLGEMRGQDVVVRTGGEEFVLLMPQTDANAAATACERLRASISDAAAKLGLERWQIYQAIGQIRAAFGPLGLDPAVI